MGFSTTYFYIYDAPTTAEPDKSWKGNDFTTKRVEQGWVCPHCGRVNAPWVQVCSCYYENKRYSNILIPACCRGCSNHPSNGGSGICNCTAPYFSSDYPYKITC